MRRKIDKSKLDVSQIFLVFMATVGDVDRTASALNIDPEVVKSLSEDEGWESKIRRISVMSKSEKPGDWERAQNRALNFVQAHRIRMMIDRFIREVSGQECADDFLKYFKTFDRNSNTQFSAKILADLSSAVEKCHAMTYMALGDTISERKTAIEEDGVQVSARSLHASLINALNQASFSPEVERKILLEGAEQRYAELMRDEDNKLTQAELDLGWHFCAEWDCLLVGPGMDEYLFCKRGPGCGFPHVSTNS